MKKIDLDKLEKINGGLADLKCIYAGMLTVHLSLLGLGGFMYNDAMRCLNS